MFDSLTAEARRPHWYVEGQVQDTIDGRFAVLATIIALALVRLEQMGDEGNQLSVALTERFIAVMESEHRELGLGDPTLGKKVRKLVASLARRVGLWRTRMGSNGDWVDAVRQSVYKDAVAPAALQHSSAELERFSARLGRTDLAALGEGRLS
ncbi:MAG: ubiquinol-cytochrome C chaperone family protein [Pseudomonadota bacterium]